MLQAEKNQFKKITISSFLADAINIVNVSYVIDELRLFGGDALVFCTDELSDFGESSLFTRTDVVLIAVFTLLRLFCGGGGYSYMPASDSKQKNKGKFLSPPVKCCLILRDLISLYWIFYFQSNKKCLLLDETP